MKSAFLVLALFVLVYVGCGWIGSHLESERQLEEAVRGVGWVITSDATRISSDQQPRPKAIANGELSLSDQF
jgi:hypothetical protein